MPTPTFAVPKGTKLEIVYSNKHTTSFTIDFVSDGGQSQRLVSETVDGDSGDLLPFMLLNETGTLKMATAGAVISGPRDSAIPTARITLCASPYFMARYVVSGGGNQSAEVKVNVTQGTP